MRGFSFLIIPIILVLLAAQPVSGSTISITQMPALYVSDYGAGVSHPINSYNLSPDQAVSDGAWMLLATNDQATFARIDARKGVAFAAGEARQYDVANSAPYRWYYLYLQEGFPVGSSLELHLSELSPAPQPTARQSEAISMVIERVPLVVIADLAGNSKKLHRYLFTSSENLPAVQSWQVYGTNNPDMLGSANPGEFTLLDNRSGIAFSGGIPQQFNVAGSPEYQYYVIYLQSGFSVRGMTLEIRLHEPDAEPTPTPTPTVTPTPPTLPVADFEGTPRAGYVPLQVSFTDRSTGTISTWSWDFGDGDISSEQNPVHRYSGAGLFHVNLTVCNDGGCSWRNRSNYVFTLPQSEMPTTTPRYYIQIGSGSSGSSSTGTSSKSATSKDSGQGTEGTAGDGDGGGAQGAGSTGTSSGSGSGGSGGSQGSRGTGGPASRENPNPGQAQPIHQSIIQTIIDALDNIGTTTEDLFAYLMERLGFLFGR